MEYLLPLAIVAITQLLAVISPGQSFVLISKLGLSSLRQVSLSAVLGLGVGTIIWASAAVLGMALVLEAAGWAYSAFKIAGGLYLLWLAFTLWRKANQPLDMNANGQKTTTAANAFLLGLFTQIANPKVIVFFGSIFFALLPQDSPAWVYVAAVAISAFNEVTWYAIVALAFSASGPRKMYLRAKTWIDRVMAGFLALIGGRLIADSL